MNNDLEQFSEERLNYLSEFGYSGADEVCALARIALAAKQPNTKHRASCQRKGIP